MVVEVVVGVVVRVVVAVVVAVEVAVEVAVVDGVDVAEVVTVDDELKPDVAANKARELVERD